MTVTWDMWLHRQVGMARRRWQNRRQRQHLSEQVQPEEEVAASPIELTSGAQGGNPQLHDGLQRRNLAQSTQPPRGQVDEVTPQRVEAPLQVPETDTKSHAIPVLTGICIIIAFFGMIQP